MLLSFSNVSEKKKYIEIKEPRYIALFVVSRFIKTLFSIDYAGVAKTGGGGKSGGGVGKGGHDNPQ